MNSLINIQKKSLKMFSKYLINEKTGWKMGEFSIPSNYYATIRPSSILTMRSAIWAIAGLWVIMTIV